MRCLFSLSRRFGYFRFHLASIKATISSLTTRNSNMKSSDVSKTIIRRILRNLKTNVPLVGGDSSQPTRAFVVEQYRSSGSPTQFKLSETYAQLLTDLKERKRLHELDTGADLILSPRELSRRAAARAGLQLPQLDEGHPSFLDDPTNMK